MVKKIPRIIALTMLLMIGVVSVSAQDTTAECRLFQDRAFSDLGINCAGAEGNTACYGFGSILSLFSDGNEVLGASVLEEAGETAPLAETTPDFLALGAFQGAPFDLGEAGIGDETWGVQVLYTPANLPREASERGAMLLAFGDVYVENGVFPDETFLPGDTVSVTADNATVFTAPPGYREPSLAVTTETGTFNADAISPDGEWVRVYYVYERTFGERADAWLRVTDLQDTPDLTSLPVLGPDDFTPYQEFFLVEGNSVPECENLPASGVLLQGPEETETDFYVNGIHVRLTSTAYVEIAGSGLRFTAIAGIIVLEPGTPRETVLLPGFSTTFGVGGTVNCFGEPVNLGLDFIENNGVADFGACGFGPLVSVTSTQSGRFGPFRQIPPNLPIYPVVPPIIIIISGIGGPTEIIDIPQVALNRIERLCELGLLDPVICARFGIDAPQ